MSNVKPILHEILLPWQRRWVEETSRFKIGLWSRQTEKSFSTAAEAVSDCAAQPKNRSTLWVVLSAGERQASIFKRGLGKIQVEMGNWDFAGRVAR